MPADPTPAPAPEWAVKMAAHYHGYDEDEPVGIHREAAVDALALLLASVRDAALREAAGVSNVLAAEFELNRDAYSDAKAKGADECTDAILSLVGTAPKEAT